jgi:hypothetical protein
MPLPFSFFLGGGGGVGSWEETFLMSIREILYNEDLKRRFILATWIQQKKCKLKIVLQYSLTSVHYDIQIMFKRI